MKKLLLVAAIVVIASAPALAGRNGAGGRRNGVAKTPQARTGKGNAAALQQQRQAETQRIHEAAWEHMAWLCGALDLTEEQQAAIEEIRDNARQAAEAAETPEAKREIMQAAHEEILAVLTAEQLEKLEQLRARVWQGKGGPWGPRSGREYMAWLFGALDLTEEQQAAIEEIRDAAREAAEAAETPEAKREILQAAHEEILAVLTAEQLEKLEQLRAQMWQGPRGPSGPGGGAGLEAVDLTEAQQVAIEQIRANARKAAQAAETRQARREIMQAAHQEIMALLSPEQLEQIRLQTRQGRVGPWRPHGRR